MIFAAARLNSLGVVTTEIFVMARHNSPGATNIAVTSTRVTEVSVSDNEAP
jgi:hypothetical protein